MLALKTYYSLRTTVAVKTSSIEAFGVGRTSYPVASFPEDLALFSLSCPQWQTPFPGLVFDRLTLYKQHYPQGICKKIIRGNCLTLQLSNIAVQIGLTKDWPKNFKEKLANEIFMRRSVKLEHIHGNLESYTYIQGCAHTQNRRWKVPISLLTELEAPKN